MFTGKIFFIFFGNTGCQASTHLGLIPTAPPTVVPHAYVWSEVKVRQTCLLKPAKSSFVQNLTGFAKIYHITPSQQNYINK